MQVLGEPTGSSNVALGLPPDARVLIVNADDFGMYQAVNAAVIRSIEHGIASSCSVMTRCPAADDALQLLQERPDVPFGIHLTLVCDTPDRRWGPLSPKAEVPSLLQEDGNLFSPVQVPELLARARVEDVDRQFRAQIRTVLDFGLSPTHLDWHCLADGGRDDIFECTLALADEYGLALRIWLDPTLRRVRGRGVPFVDHPFLDSFALHLDGKANRYAELLRTLPVGLSEWAVHPGLGDDEAQEIDDCWRVQRTDLDFLTSQAAGDIVAEEGIIVTDYRSGQQVWRKTREPAF